MRRALSGILLVVALDVPNDVRAAGGWSVVIGSKDVVVAGGVETEDRHLGRTEFLSCGSKCHGSSKSPITMKGSLRL